MVDPFYPGYSAVLRAGGWPPATGTAGGLGGCVDTKAMPRRRPVRGLEGEHLTGSGSVRHAGRTPPVGGDQEQRAPIGTAERASEAAAVELHRVEDRASLAYAHRALVGDVAVPDRPVGIEADAVGNTLAEPAQDRRFDRSPSAATSNAVSLFA